MYAKRALVLAETEVAEGVLNSPPPSETDNSLQAFEINVDLQGEEVAREVLSTTFSPVGFIVGVRFAEVTFSTEMRGMGAIPTASSPLCDLPLWLAAGMTPTYSASSCVFNPKTDFTTVNSANMYFYMDGILHVLLGTRGNWALSGEVGKFGKNNWRFFGAFGTITGTSGGLNTDGVRDADIPTSPTYQNPNLKPPSILGCTFSIAGYQARIQSFGFDLGNDVQQDPDITAPTGIANFFIGGRKPTGTINPQAVKRATHDFWGRWANAATGALALQVGATAGNIIKVDVPAMQYGKPGWTDRNGKRAYELPFTCNRNADAGDDEIGVTFK